MQKRIEACFVKALQTLARFGDTGDFRLEDALQETSSVKQKWDHVATTTTRRPGTTRAPANPAGNGFDLADALDNRDDGRRKPSAGGGEDLDVHFFDPQTTPRTYPKKTDRWDRFTTTTTRRPATTRAPANLPGIDDFDLADALDDRNDRDDGRRKPSAGGGGDGPYGGSDDPESGMSAEAGTIAGVASALAMALIGAVSSYISYQQKKFCFSIQQGLNADYVKGENLEAVVCEEPQVKYSSLQAQTAQPPAPEPPRI
ncbi:CD99 antigen-like protein 2 [Trichechus manatus latirostris]|uniref:CD99 antigen-like protein 2 n=1 Tax=Trichechus manatus latirostris TaxID=127582 RepID=A0A2Y9QII1_TRIMA|nr:CD99 antigen-like protein 2 [Trichechus manatus latirostris]